MDSKSNLEESDLSGFTLNRFRCVGHLCSVASLLVGRQKKAIRILIGDFIGANSVIEVRRAENFKIGLELSSKVRLKI